MAPLIATTIIIVMVVALAVVAPIAPPPQRSRPAHLRPAHLRPPDQPSASARRLPTPRADRLIRSIRARPSARLGFSLASAALLVVAVATIGYPFYTNLRQERLQSQLDRQLQSPDLRAAYLERSVDEGDSLTRLLIPDLRVSVVVVEGTSSSALRAGAGHYADTPLPCEIGNVAIAGHRTTYGRPFHNLDRLTEGDEITLETPIGSCTYRITRDPFIVSPAAVEVLANTPDEATLTLTTCHPKGSSRERMIVKATLVRSSTGAAAS